MASIHFDRVETWNGLVESAIGMPEALFKRLSAAELQHSCWDCSGLDHVFNSYELDRILRQIENALSGWSIRLYHGCRFSDGEDPAICGLQASSTSGIAASLLSLAERDPLLSGYIKDIKTTVADKFYQDQARIRNNQIWFCLTEKEMIEEYGVYTVFGSEYRLLILNGINDALKNRLLLYGTPAVIVVELPIQGYLSEYKNKIAKFLFALWIHHRLEFQDYDTPTGFSCYIKTNVPAEHVKEILRPERAYDQYNTPSRWYTWDEMFIQE